MRPLAQKQTVRINSGVVNSTVMTISSDAVDAAFVLQSMTDLYADKMLALIREITTNAADAHAAAGQKRPIEVTLPTQTKPTFVVQDWGTGLNWDDLENIYAKFGRSTKRESDTETGMLGFGCKAPLSYCLSFTVVGVKDGIKTVAVVSKGDNGIGEIKQLGHAQPTDEPNGVTVSAPIALADLNSFRDKANSFFRFWREGVLVDGEPPTLIECVLELDPDLWVISTQYNRYAKSYVVQGNVPYEYNTPDGLPATVAWVEIGNVSFPPSRESLQDDERTRSALKTIREVVKDRLDKVISYEIEAAPNSYEKWRRRIRLHDALPYGYQHPQLRWSANDLRFIDPKERDLPYYQQTEKFGWEVSGGTAQRCNALNTGWIMDRYDRSRHTFITGFNLKGVSPSHKERIHLAGISEPYVIVPANCGIPMDGFPGVKWEDIPPLPRAERVASTKAAPQRPLFRTETKYSFFLAGTKTEEPVYTGDFKVLYVDNDEAVARTLSKLFPVAAASIIVANQEGRFRRLHNGAEFWRPWLVEQIDDLSKRLTKGDRRCLAMTITEREIWEKFGSRWKEIRDPELRRFLKVERSPQLEKLLEVHRAFRHYPSLWGSDLAVKLHAHTQSGYRIDWPTAFEPYPLIRRFNNPSDLSYAPIDDLILYLNAKYRENQKKKDETAAEAA